MKIDYLKIAYDKCVDSGSIKKANEVDSEKAKTLLENAELDIDSFKDATALFEKKNNFGLLWSNHYEIIRQLVAGILLFEKVISDNHKCLYAYICTKHQEWDVDWKTIETMRLLRNGVHYDGRPVSAETWKEYKLKFEIYTKTFIKILKEKLKNIQ
ncbi:hypothetical protein ISS05_04785 [Candidatus Woesearchaeota archaeon]|nr:hypothetical protein [Candidatus Woesearchaeota archaeon]